MDTLVSMKVFRQVVEVGSFVGAAERMEMSAAMASKHVMHLEQQLGARLLNRTTRRVAPTEAGREYYERLSQVLTELEEAEQVVGAASVVPQGRLRVSSLSAFGLSHVMAAVADYAAQYPQVTVDITLSDRVVELIDEGFDVAIRASPSGLKSSSLIARPIAMAHLVLCASPAYLRRRGIPKTAADLARHNFLQYAGVSALDVMQNTGEAARVRLSGNLIVNHLEAQRVMVLHGAGIALLGTEVIGADLAEGRLVPLLVDEMPPRELPIHVVYASRRHLSAKVRSFVDFLAERFANESLWPSLEQIRALAGAPLAR
ncbi:LysR family transcriptional regulator [bacterium M00.F.Ca.ET.228.01.1.1]|uniref:LysR family transcriptional regulator n=1 Tax=Paraburkholderia phenoliruptrix TaxID=252970 RepID=UPI001091D815|nr:LysR family transcriptional regulator [Paraburkholderia phenoliruptrix]TGP44752.1 LysR family transcriptional regulator [bacterium M00.F.Ca.ET.228.01.1.1]TGS02635.1 LysR family transcriptional regulator [bacterium M00.F.Ca.ET.191.01.1.1]TGU06017.1 LysR family transcriptional regulator [bacterium M00.F.Ca.ET.155.01.1.1]MBW0450265.1 LysR family transcriptional regulator [Paraburkholderia phenoliruptrix]MBW9099954.1 LysR family transcriptional regulator [Paraburkholderia phenoliruptrix]